MLRICYLFSLGILCFNVNYNCLSCDKLYYDGKQVVFRHKIVTVMKPFAKMKPRITTEHHITSLLFI